MPARPRTLLAAIATLFGGLAFTAAGEAAAPAALSLEPCRIEHPEALSALAAECGTFTVAENPAAPRGRRIDLHVARVPAINRRKKPDPLFVLAGGPGMAATDFYAGASPAFARIHRDRDIVLLDQRGTGRSNALSCELDEDVLWRATEAVIAAETQRCLAGLATRADVRFYTTSVAVRDLEALRAALGYERINLYGVSYGTRVAQHYLRRHPQRVRTVILDGVVPPEVALGPELARHAEGALQSILARCAHSPPCRERFGDPARSYRALRRALALEPERVNVADPATGSPVSLEFTELHLATVLRLASYSHEQAALLPLSLHLAEREHEFGPLAAQFLLTSRAYGGVLAYGMHNAVVCSEDVPFYRVTEEERRLIARTYLGTTQLDGLRSACAVWPRGIVDADFHAPLRTAVPALLLSGSDDPVTPPHYAEQALRGFTKGRHVVLRGLGHGQLGTPCVDRLMAQFVELGAAGTLDTRCTRRVAPAPFFTSLAGPAP